jgi:hypothetical protein
LELSEEQARRVRFILEWLKEHYGDEAEWTDPR